MKAKITWTSFSAGFLAAMAVRMLIEDAYGHERMIIQVTENWTTPWIGVPCAITGLTIAAFIVWRNRLIERLLIYNIKEFFNQPIQQYSATIKGTREERN